MQFAYTFYACHLKNLARFSAIFCLIALAACSSSPKILTATEQTAKLSASLQNGGYNSENQFEINSQREIWHFHDSELEVVLTTPKPAGNYPVIIYLPSLGEEASAGKLWRESWTKAGYAVLSLQPMSIGQAIKEFKEDQKQLHLQNSGDQSEDKNPDSDKNSAFNWFASDKKAKKTDNTSDIRYLGHEYFSVEQLKYRLEALFWAYQQLSNKVASGLPEYHKLDLNNIILSGYDLGAQTAAAALGEDFLTKLPEDANFKPKASILLSPSVDLAEGNVRNRFKKITTPMLVITSSDDNDPYNISSGSVRSAIWEFAPAGNKYLLLLNGNVHPLLAGNGFGGRNAESDEQNLEEDISAMPGDSNSGRRRGGHLQNQVGGNGSGSRAGKHAEGGGVGGAHVKAHNKNGELAYKQVAAVISTSEAFLDHLFKNDEFAQLWIRDKVNKWLDRAGNLTLR